MVADDREPTVELVVRPPAREVSAADRSLARQDVVLSVEVGDEVDGVGERSSTDQAGQHGWGLLPAQNADGAPASQD
jgi:hypothetical protein